MASRARPRRRPSAGQAPRPRTLPAPTEGESITDLLREQATKYLQSFRAAGGIPSTPYTGLLSPDYGKHLALLMFEDDWLTGAVVISPSRMPSLLAQLATKHAGNFYELFAPPSGGDGEARDVDDTTPDVVESDSD